MNASARETERPEAQEKKWNGIRSQPKEKV